MGVDPGQGKPWLAGFASVEGRGGEGAWVGLFPVTGRTHQRRVHMAEFGTPIVGDGKYGGPEAFLQGEGVSRKLHLHARAIRIPGPGGRPLEIVAPLDDHMKRSWAFFGLDEAAGGDPFEPFEE